MESEFPGQGPVGVCGQIIPWNFPLLMLAWKIAPALAAGNTVVLKPAEFTPLTALAFAEICVEAGLPPGVVNIVTGDGATGAALVAHPDVDKIAFTGSTEVGRMIRRATAGTGKKLSLELGGKSPFIVFDDADLDSAVEGVVDAIWFNQGQVCCAGSRLLVAESVERKFVAKLRARMAMLTVGDPLDKSTDIGAIVAPVQLERIQRLVEAGRAEGAEIYQPEVKLPGARLLLSADAGHRRRAGLAARARGDIRPGAGGHDFRTPDEAVALANNTRYGLAASIWSENINRALEVAARIKAGVVWINSTNLFDAAAGFGGYRESGFGREGGREGLAEYLKAEDAPRRGGGEDLRSRSKLSAAPGPAPAASGIDRTAKMYIGGKQARPDSGVFLQRARSQGPLARPGRPRQSQGHPQRRRSREQGRRLGRGDRAQPRAGALLYRREPRGARRRIRRASARDDRRECARGARGSRRFDPPAVLLRGLRRQIRRRGARDAEAVRHAGDERALGRDGHRLPRRSAAARLRLAGRAGDRDGQRGRRRAQRRASARRDRFLFGARHVRRARRRRQHRHRRGRWRSPRRSPSTTASTRCGTRTAAGAKAVEAASAGNLKATWTLGAGGGLARGRRGASSCAARRR